MAREFDNGSSQYLQVQSTPVTAAPFTMACWYQYSTDTSGVLFGIGDKDTTSNMWLVYTNTGGADVLTAYRVGGGTDLTHAGAITKDTWHHAAIAVAAVDDLTLYNDASGTAESTSIAIANWDSIYIGCEADSNRGTYLTGYVAELALWNVELTQAEIDILNARYSPLFVRPQSLVAYWPLIRDEDQDRVGGYDLTAYNSPTIAAHPPIIYPAPPFVGLAAAGAPPVSAEPKLLAMLGVG